MVLQFKRRAVPFLWSPRKGVNSAWRVGARSAVLTMLPLELRSPAQSLATREWHALCRAFMDKYGTDWSFRDGFDDNALTDTEYAHYCVVRNTVQDERRNA